MQKRLLFSPPTPELLPGSHIPPVIASGAMHAAYDLARAVAPYPTTVLISGETGTGKEVLASYIHYISPRARHPFIRINCGAIPENLLESELFGYEQGAFTGGRREGAMGVFEAAHPGTLLLDEISELPLKAQVKLLRALQEKEIRRVGGTWSKVIDVRVIASTNQDLAELVERGLFRRDLFYRLDVVHIHLPPLRQRPEDIAPLLEHFCNQLNEAYGLQKRFSPAAVELLQKAHWPGNVRQLRNLVERMLITCPKQLIEADDLPAEFRGNAGAGAQDTSRPTTLQEIVHRAEKEAILQALQKYSDKRLAARALGIDPSTLSRKMRRLGI
ncbi:MAG: sigma-54 interaction domain-containing protein [Bacillota bacterium]